MELNNYESVMSYLENQNGFTEQEINSICTTILNINNTEQAKKITVLFLEKIENYLTENSNNYTEQELEKKINHIINILSTNDITNSILIEKKFTLEETLKRIRSSQFDDEEELDEDTKEKLITAIKYDINNLSELDTNKISNIIKNIKSISFISNNEYVKLKLLLQEKVKNLVDVIHNDKTAEEKNNILKDIINDIEVLFTEKSNVGVKKDDGVEEKEIEIIKRIVENLPGKEIQGELIDKQAELKEHEKILISRIKRNIPEEFNNSDNYLAEIDNEIALIEEELRDIELVSSIIDSEKSDEEKKAELMEKITYLNEYKIILEGRIKRARPDEIDGINATLTKVTSDLSKFNKALNEILFGKSQEHVVDKEKESELMEKITDLNEYKLTLEGRIKRARPEEIDGINATLTKVKNDLSKAHKELDEILFGKAEEHIDRKEKKAELIKRLEQLKYAKKEILEANESLTKTKEKLVEVDKSLNDLMNNYSLKDVINAYYQIIEDTVNHFNDENEKSIDNIQNYINNHQLLSVLNKYENSEKLKSELFETIKSKLNISNKITKKENNKVKWMKAIGGIATGLSLGLAFSCVPHNQLILIGTPLIKGGVKFIHKSINIYCQNNPQGKIAKFKKSNKYKNITAKVNKLKEKLKESPLKYFINEYTKTGFIIGNIAGNLVESITGENVFEHAKDLFNNNSNGFSQVTGGNVTPSNVTPGNVTPGNVTPGNVTPGNVTPGNVTPGNVTPGNITPDLLTNPQIDFSNLAGQSFDLSSVPQGFTSSYSDTPVNLITESAKNLSWDKANFVNGEEWWHFLKPDGEGYAWFKADDVRHLVDVVAKSGKSL